MLIFCGNARAQAPAADNVAARKTVTLAAYNVEWMTDVFDDPYTEDEAKPPKPHKDLEQIARALRTLDADVVTFTEVENEGLLRAFVGEMLGDMGYRHVAVPITNSGRGQNVGVISRLPIVSLTSYRFMDLKDEDAAVRDGQTDTDGKTWQFARDLVQVKLQVTPTRTLTVFAVHFKSKWDSAGDKKSVRWRKAEAVMARQIIADMLKHDPDAWITLQGDFNDTPESATLEALLKREQGGQAVLIDQHAGMPKEARITYLKPPYRNAGPIDYILASPALHRRLVADSARVLADESLLSGSDHAPIVAMFEVTDQHAQAASRAAAPATTAP
ncbi:MAG: endonuclease/exonuclease/phosphatase family protein [Phycisphaeraceae bacterium]